MRRYVILVTSLFLIGLQSTQAAGAEERKTSERVIGEVISGLLGQPQAPDAAYTAQDQERLVSLLQSGEYATSRQGEPVDMIVLGVPLTQLDHVYTARPIQPSRTSSR